jgi:hypothetical protein
MRGVAAVADEVARVGRGAVVDGHDRGGYG